MILYVAWPMSLVCFHFLVCMRVCVFFFFCNGVCAALLCYDCVWAVDGGGSGFENGGDRRETINLMSTTPRNVRWVAAVKRTTTAFSFLPSITLELPGKNLVQRARKTLDTYLWWLYTSLR